MRVFCLSTGRCGTTTFTASMSHAINFTSGHETRTRILGEARLDYPDQHVEADNRLSWFLGALGQRFGDDATYVHLTRSRSEVIRSIVGRRTSPLHIIPAFGHGIMMRAEPYPEDEWHEVAGFYVDTVTANIESFLEGRPRVVRMRLEDPLPGITRLWDMVGANGDLLAALTEWSVRHNASAPAITT
jgi:hypothetical protein